MGTIALLGAGVFLGWVLFGRRGSSNENRQHYAGGQEKLIQQNPKSNAVSSGKTANYATQPAARVQERNPNSNSQHTLRNVAGGMVAGAVLGHMLSGDHKAEAHETINNYNTYNELYDHDDWENEDYDTDYDGDGLDYQDEDDSSELDYVDYDSYDDDDSYDSYDYDADSYDSGSDWGSDSYDGGDW